MQTNRPKTSMFRLNAEIPVFETIEKAWNTTIEDIVSILIYLLADHLLWGTTALFFLIIKIN